MICKIPYFLSQNSPVLFKISQIIYGNYEKGEGRTKKKQQICIETTKIFQNGRLFLIM